MGKTNAIKLDDLFVYQLAMKLGDDCWGIYMSWSYDVKDTLGKQLVRSADSVAANIAEGYGRFHYKENRYFNFIARGSLFETKTWVEKASRRKLIANDQFETMKGDLNQLARLLNGYIRKIGESSIVSEPVAYYGNTSMNRNADFELTEEDLKMLDILPFPEERIFPIPND